MKYLKLYENKELVKDLDPFDEEDWDEVEMDDNDDIIKCYYMIEDGEVIIQNGTLSNTDIKGGRYLLDKDNRRILYIRNNLQILYDRGYLLLKSRNVRVNHHKPNIIITTNRGLIEQAANYKKINGWTKND